MVRRLPRTLGLLGYVAGSLVRQVYRDLQIEAPLHIHITHISQDATNLGVFLSFYGQGKTQVLSDLLTGSWLRDVLKSHDSQSHCFLHYTF